jgi:hypothetical protein
MKIAFMRHDGKLKIGKYKAMEYVKDSDVERMMSKYDCSCEVS